MSMRPEPDAPGPDEHPTAPLPRKNGGCRPPTRSLTPEGTRPSFWHQGKSLPSAGSCSHSGREGPAAGPDERMGVLGEQRPRHHHPPTRLRQHRDPIDEVDLIARIPKGGSPLDPPHHAVVLARLWWGGPQGHRGAGHRAWTQRTRTEWGKHSTAVLAAAGPLSHGELAFQSGRPKFRALVQVNLGRRAPRKPMRVRQGRNPWTSAKAGYLDGSDG